MSIENYQLHNENFLFLFFQTEEDQGQETVDRHRKFLICSMCNCIIYV